MTDGYRIMQAYFTAKIRRRDLLMRPRIFAFPLASASALRRVVKERDMTDGAGLSVRATWGVSRIGRNGV